MPNKEQDLKNLSDSELSIMRDELKNLLIRFDDHVVKFDDHILIFDDHIIMESKKTIDMIEVMKLNTVAINNLTTETKSVVNLQRDLQATARVGKAIQGFLIWTLKWCAIGSSIVYGFNWLLDYLSHCHAWFLLNQLIAELP